MFLFFGAVQKELSIESSQILALFNKGVRKVSQYLRAVQEQALTKEVTATAPQAVPAMKPAGLTLEADLKASSAQLKQKQKEKEAKVKADLQALNLEQYVPSRLQFRPTAFPDIARVWCWT